MVLGDSIGSQDDENREGGLQLQGRTTWGKRISELSVCLSV